MDDLGLQDFTAFRTSIGEELVFFGRIELFVFVRSALLEDGVIKPLKRTINNVKTGINLGVVGTAPNKGLSMILWMMLSFPCLICKIRLPCACI